MRKLNRAAPLIFLISIFISLSSCSEDKENEPYPSLITELVDCPTDDKGTMSEIILDDDTRLPLTNPMTELKPSVVYRALAGYTVNAGQATLYSASPVVLLRDSTSSAACDPVNVVSIWRTNRYLNLHLMPKTQNQGNHSWGFITDSIVSRHAYLRLHHRQGTDPKAYSTDQYASLPLKLVDADTLTLRVTTFSGIREWTL